MAADRGNVTPACTCPYTPPEMWLSAASCGYGSGYEPGSMQEWDPDCPVHPAGDVWDGCTAPGGYVCGVCGMPTESEPCAKHPIGASVVGSEQGEASGE